MKFAAFSTLGLTAVLAGSLLVAQTPQTTTTTTQSTSTAPATPVGSAKRTEETGKGKQAAGEVRQGTAQSLEAGAKSTESRKHGKHTVMVAAGVLHTRAVWHQI